jgi:hypothetical protein
LEQDFIPWLGRIVRVLNQRALHRHLRRLNEAAAAKRGKGFWRVRRAAFCGEVGLNPRRFSHPRRKPRKHSRRRGHYPRMNSTLRQLAPVAVAVVASLSLSSCARRPIIVQAAPATVIQSPAAAPAPTGRDVIVVREAPPAPRSESMSAQPSPQQTWVPGYWSWHEGKHTWVAGHWETPPSPGAVWVAPRWEQRADGYAFTPGGWR